MLGKAPLGHPLALPQLARAGAAALILASSSAAPAAPQSDYLFQDAYVKASNSGSGDAFGHSVAVFGDRVLVGAPDEDSASTGVDDDQLSNASSGSGAAYLFQLVGGQWVQEAYFKASNTGFGDGFGTAVALGDDIVVIGAPGEDGDGTSPSSDGATDSGAVYVFRLTGSGGAGQWIQTQYLKASNAGSLDGFGAVLALDGGELIIGAEGEDSGSSSNPFDNTVNDAGAAYVFSEDSSQNWSQSAYLKAEDPDVADFFGASVAIDATSEPGLVRALVGAPFDDSDSTGIGGDPSNNDGSNSGAAFLLQSSGSGWQLEAFLKGSNTGVGDQFGTSVDLDGDRLVVGAPFEDSSIAGVNPLQTNNSLVSAGAAYSYRIGFSGWAQDAYVKASNPGAFDYFGARVQLDSDRLVVTASREASASSGIGGNQASNTAGGSGACYLYSGLYGSVWVQTAFVKSSNSEANDYFGSPIGLSDRWFIAGAAREDGADSGINGSQFSNGFAESGAAYFFRLGDGPFLNYCTPTLNSTVRFGTMSGSGSGLLSQNDVTLMAASLPPNAFAFFIVGSERAFVPNPAGSAGNLCVGGGALGRYVGPGQVQNAGPGGMISLAIDANAIPSAVGAISALPGDEFHFQAWYRDSVGGMPVSNFTDGMTVLFR